MGAFNYGQQLPADILAQLDEAGIVTISAQRAYREARIDGASHDSAIECALMFVDAEDETMFGGEG